MFENLHSTTFSCNLFLQGGFTGVKFTRISVVLKIILMEIVKLPFIAYMGLSNEFAQTASNIWNEVVLGLFILK